MPIPPACRHPALYAIVSILLGEAVLPALLYRPPTGDMRVNPFARRDWDRYIQRTAVKHDPETRVLVLSNSQGRGPEYGPEQVYTTVLQAELNRTRRGSRVRVVNWSFGPNRVPEAIVLLARARDLAPHVTLAVFPPVWFQEQDYVFDGRSTPLSMFPGDVADTAWLYRDRLPVAFRQRYLGPREAARAYLARYMPTFRLRDLPVSFLQARWPWLAAFVPEGELASWYLSGRGQTRPLARRLRVEGSSVPIHAPLLRMFDDAAADLPGKRVFVFQPHWYDAPGASKAVLPLAEELLRNGWEVWDMMDSVPWTEFLEGQNIHLSADGHALFGRALAGRVRPLIEGVP